MLHSDQTNDIVCVSGIRFAFGAIRSMCCISTMYARANAAAAARNAKPWCECISPPAASRHNRPNARTHPAPWTRRTQKGERCARIQTKRKRQILFIHCITLAHIYMVQGVSCATPSGACARVCVCVYVQARIPSAAQLHAIAFLAPGLSASCDRAFFSHRLYVAAAAIPAQAHSRKPCAVVCTSAFVCARASVGLHAFVRRERERT